MPRSGQRATSLTQRQNVKELEARTVDVVDRPGVRGGGGKLALEIDEALEESPIQCGFKAGDPSRLLVTQKTKKK
jgi:hypothetical protein